MGFDKCKESCNRHQNQDMEQSITSPNFVLPLTLLSFSSTHPLAATHLFSFPVVYLFQKCHINGMLEYVAF